MGRCLGVVVWKPLTKWTSSLLGLLFIGLSVVVYLTGTNNEWISFTLGILACVAVVEFVLALVTEGQQSAVFAFLAKYTMPIFVIHTLFAAPYRAVLLKVGISNFVIHVIDGITISFVGPIIAAQIMKKTKILEFFLYPGKVFKVELGR